MTEKQWEVPEGREGAKCPTAYRTAPHSKGSLNSKRQCYQEWENLAPSPSGHIDKIEMPISQECGRAEQLRRNAFWKLVCNANTGCYCCIVILNKDLFWQRYLRAFASLFSPWAVLSPDTCMDYSLCPSWFFLRNHLAIEVIPGLPK